MITVNKANPTPGEITSSLTGSTGDGAGLNLANNGYIQLANNAATEFSTTDFSIEFVLNQTADNVLDSYIYSSHIGGNSRVIFWNDISADVIIVRFIDSSGSNTDVTLSYDMSQDYGTPTHYVLAFDRSADLTLYKNGNSVASVDISASASINIGAGNANVSRIGSDTSYGVLGTFYRFRAFNTLADAKLLFERADVPRTLTANLLFDLDLAFANPTQSLTVQDASGAADGTCSATGVTQVQPVVQLNSTSARIGTSAATPADGEVIADKVKIGTESFTPHASVDDFTIAPSGAAAGLTIRAGSNSGTSRIAFADLASTTVGLITYDHNTDNLTLAADDDVVLSSGAGAGSLTIASTGLATFSGGINLGDTTLANYEQGNFTLTDASGAGLTITGGLGRYTRIGNTVHVTVQFTMPTTSDSSSMKLSGLPYAVPNDNDYRGLVLNYSNKTGVEYALTEKNSDDIGFYTDVGANSTNADGSGGGFYINGHYKV